MDRTPICRVQAMRDMINSLNEAEMGGDVPGMGAPPSSNSDVDDGVEQSPDELIAQFQAAIDSNDENAVRDLATIENIKMLIDHAQGDQGDDQGQDDQGGMSSPMM